MIGISLSTKIGKACYIPIGHNNGFCLEKTKVIESDAPSIEQNGNFSKLTRKEALAESKRIVFENNNIVGSINTVGAVIDDLTFKNYNVQLNSNEKVILLNPRKDENG